MEKTNHSLAKMSTWKLCLQPTVGFEQYFLPCTGWKPKETALERAGLTVHLLMFVTAEKEEQMFMFFFLSNSCQLLSPRFQARKG